MEGGDADLRQHVVWDDGNLFIYGHQIRAPKSAGGGLCSTTTSSPSIPPLSAALITKLREGAFEGRRNAFEKQRNNEMTMKSSRMLLRAGS